MISERFLNHLYCSYLVIGVQRYNTSSFGIPTKHDANAIAPSSPISFPSKINILRKRSSLIVQICIRFLIRSFIPLGPRPWLILHFSEVHLSLYGSVLLYFLWSSKCSLQYVCWQRVQIWNSLMHCLVMHVLLLHTVHLMQCSLHTGCEQVKHLEVVRQVEQNKLLQTLQQYCNVSERVVSKSLEHPQHNDLRMHLIY